MEALAQPPPRRLLPRVRLSRPAEDEVRAVIEASRGAPFSYPHVGASAGDLPDGWYHTELGRRLGVGDAVWERAVEALQAWRHFALDWVELVSDGPPEVGRVVAFASWQYGAWSIHACRVLEVIDEEDDDGRTFGFAYGTLPRHGVRGEERFLLHQDAASGAVRFTIRQFSLPSSWLTTAMGPLARGVQLAFVHDALDAMCREVAP